MDVLSIICWYFLFQCILHFQGGCCCLSRDCCQQTPHTSSPLHDALPQVSQPPGHCQHSNTCNLTVWIKLGHITQRTFAAVFLYGVIKLIVYLCCCIQGSFLSIIGKACPLLGGIGHTSFSFLSYICMVLVPHKKKDQP